MAKYYILLEVELRAFVQVVVLRRKLIESVLAIKSCRFSREQCEKALDALCGHDKTSSLGIKGETDPELVALFEKKFSKVHSGVQVRPK